MIKLKQFHLMWLPSSKQGKLKTETISSFQPLVTSKILPPFQMLRGKEMGFAAHSEGDQMWATLEQGQGEGREVTFKTKKVFTENALPAVPFSY